jgi:hypothetical protein
MSLPILPDVGVIDAAACPRRIVLGQDFWDEYALVNGYGLTKI